MKVDDDDPPPSNSRHKRHRPQYVTIGKLFHDPMHGKRDLGLLLTVLYITSLNKLVPFLGFRVTSYMFGDYDLRWRPILGLRA